MANVKYFVTLLDQELEVEIQTTSEGGLVARIDGREYTVSLAVVENLRRYSVLLDRDSYDVMVDANGEALDLQVGPHRIHVSIEDERQRAARSIGDALPPGPTTIKSIMPGVVRKVLVQPGQEVDEGEPLLILEAMKMENEIRAEGPGRVREILVTEETPVESGAPLIAMEPLDRSLSD